MEESPGGGVTRERRQRKWRQKKRDSAVNVGLCNDSLARIFILLLSPPPTPHTAPNPHTLGHDVQLSGSLIQKNRAAFCLDSPNSFKGTTEA